MPTAQIITEHTAIRSAASATPQQACRFMLSRAHGEYTEYDIRHVIVPAYYELCTAVGIDPVLALAQMIHETGNLTSFWAARPQRNPAGLGVTGQHQAYEPASVTNAQGVRSWAYNTQRGRWESGLSFATWKDDAIPAHVGRLLAYALPAGNENQVERAAIKRALAYRYLPPKLRGTAPDLRRLGRVHNPSGLGWASPGHNYGVLLAKIAHLIQGM